MAKKIDLTKYGITGTPEILYNPSYERLFEEEMNPALTGYERGQLTDTGAVNVMTGEYTGRSPRTELLRDGRHDARYHLVDQRRV